jgi:hypothetical protein
MPRLLPPALRSGLLPRLLFLLALGGGLLWWGELRRPRDLRLSIDLTAALPGDVIEVDVVVRRGGHVLGRHEASYGSAGAPGTVAMTVHAPAGEAEVETTLAYTGKPARRGIARVRLSAKAPATVHVE